MASKRTRLGMNENANLNEETERPSTSAKRARTDHSKPINSNLNSDDTGTASIPPKVPADIHTTRPSSGEQLGRDEYQHQPLDLSSIDQIRLLCIKPSSSGVICSLQNVTMSPRTRYKAVSYTWGPPFPTKQIFIDNAPFTIRENLFHFLKMWQEGGSGELLWIDQICIDQSNNLEKNHQVNHMGQIYSNASQVLVWLGPAANDSDVAMHVIQGHHWDPSQLAEEEKQAIRALFSRPYWRRVWVLQEVMLAQSLLLLCGMKKVAWSHAERMVYLDEDTKAAGRRGMHSAKKIFMERSTFRRDYLKPLYQLLAAFLDWECEDPRDKVFGLLGMTYGGSRTILMLDSHDTHPNLGLQNSCITPRYDLPAEQICEDAIRQCVRANVVSRRSHVEAAWRLSEALMVPHLDVDRIVDEEFAQHSSGAFEIAPIFVVKIRE